MTAENFDALGNFFDGNERQIIFYIRAVGFDVECLIAAANERIDNQIRIERSRLDMRFDVVCAVDFDIRIDIVQIDRIFVVRSREQF